MKHSIAIAGLVACVAAFAVDGHEQPGAAPLSPRADVRTLQQVELDAAFTKDREVITDLVVIPPNTALEKHWHPGEEFHYYLEGEVTIEIDGQAPIVGRPGGVGHVPYRKHHRAVAGAPGAKILVVRVHSKGEPWRYAVGDAGAGDAR
jgi:quercetin dioxygenase-like cupin family protein